MTEEMELVAMTLIAHAGECKSLAYQALNEAKIGNFEEAEYLYNNIVNKLCKNIIFDFGGVVVNFNPRDFLMDHFMNRRAEEETYDIVFGSQEWQDLDRGIITREEANKIMLEKAAHANRVFEVQTCLDEWFTMLETNKTTVQIMRKLKAAGYRLYYLTNIPTDVMDELRQREWFSLFDGGIASCDVHLCKPEPEIFTTLMQTCHLAYDESIFVDDNKANAQAAYNLGITGILYKNPKSFTRALGACGIEVE